MDIFFVIITCILLFLLILWLIKIYNILYQLRNKIKDAWSRVEVDLERRYDLIPNLVETVRGYTIHEKETLTSVINARSAALKSENIEHKVYTNHLLDTELFKLYAVVESYPELKSNEQFRDFHRSLIETEDSLRMTRRYYNDVVLFYAEIRERFPTLVGAFLLGFKKMPFYKSITDKHDVPKVKF